MTRKPFTVTLKPEDQERIDALAARIHEVLTQCGPLDREDLNCITHGGIVSIDLALGRLEDVGMAQHHPEDPRRDSCEHWSAA